MISYPSLPALPAPSGPLIPINPKKPVQPVKKPVIEIGTSILKKIIDALPDKKKKSQSTSQKTITLPTFPKPGLLPKPGGLLTYPDSNTPSYSGDPGIMKEVISDSNEGYYYEPVYGYSAEPWGPGLVDTFRGSGLPDPFFV